LSSLAEEEDDNVDKKRMLMLGLYERMTLVVVFSVDRVSVLWEDTGLLGGQMACVL
tara:strand:+ start:280 stop:447 length:168 start_codon:yes stop_codon:yes gene_type:complete